MGEEHGLGSSEEDDAKHGGIPQNGNMEAGKPNQFSIPQQLSQNSAIRWERFLPIRSLKVLLVENDDSTRQVVSALLRNCSYEVTTAANGFQAWKILENMNNHVDLVLTEVVMPVLSGIGLLTKIMSHKTLKNIPVIMMSSHDSMGIVFKCLSKGAVDFLVKPIRKNELKNLWQHVWRRCHSSSGSGSGSESGTQAKNCAKSRNAENSGNDSENSHELDNDEDDDDESFRDGSDNGSGTQGSWTKKEGEGVLMADAPDSTCAQVIIAKLENDENDDTVLRETEAVGSRHVDNGRADVSNGPETATNDDRNRIRHSDLSAFCKYNTASSANQGLTGNVGSCSAVENSSEAIKTETGNNVAFQINATLPNQQSNGSSNNDIASTAKNQKSDSSSAKKSMHSSAVHPTQNGRVSCPNTKPEKTNCHIKDQHAPVQETEGTAGNYSMNGSGTGSNDVAKQPFPSLVTNENATEDDKVAEREAAVLKFRQKRKERCFDKKVRCQNRKKLTEQRPRHNGQFARQSLSANSDE